jgi:hypothetical protein
MMNAFNRDFTKLELEELARFFLATKQGIEDRDAETDAVDRKTIRTRCRLQQWFVAHWDEIREFLGHIVIELPPERDDEPGELVGPMRDTVARARANGQI